MLAEKPVGRHPRGGVRFVRLWPDSPPRGPVSPVQAGLQGRRRGHLEAAPLSQAVRGHRCLGICRGAVALVPTAQAVGQVVEAARQFRGVRVRHAHGFVQRLDGGGEFGAVARPLMAVQQGGTQVGQDRATARRRDLAERRAVGLDGRVQRPHALVLPGPLRRGAFMPGPRPQGSAQVVQYPRMVRAGPVGQPRGIPVQADCPAQFGGLAVTHGAHAERGGVLVQAASLGCRLRRRQADRRRQPGHGGVEVGEAAVAEIPVAQQQPQVVQPVGQVAAVPRRRGDGPRHQVDGPVQVARLSAQHVPFREPCPQVGQPGRKVRRIRFGQRHGLRVGGDRALQLISARGLLVTLRQRDAKIVQPARALGGHFSGQERRLGKDLGRLLQVIWTPPGQQRGAKVRQRRRAPVRVPRGGRGCLFEGGNRAVEVRLRIRAAGGT